MRETAGADHLSVAMRTPSGHFEGPLERKRLYWLVPGKALSTSKNLSSMLQENTIQEFVCSFFVPGILC